MREVKGCQTLTACQLRSWWPPVQTAGNHQVKDQPKIFIDSNPMRLPMRRSSRTMLPSTLRGRLRSSKQKCARHPHVVERLTTILVPAR